jgi:hypothetical protein
MEIEEHWSKGLNFDEASEIIHWNRKNEIYHFLHNKGFNTENIYSLIDNARSIFELEALYKRFKYYDGTKATEWFKAQDMKDWLKEDKLLQWCLENEIPDGKRNAILFKNLAIGILKCGLDPEEKNKLANRLMHNCVDTPRRKDIWCWMQYFRNRDPTAWNYNKWELNKWMILHKLYGLMYRGDKDDDSKGD